LKEAEELYEKAVKRYKYSKKVWSAYQLFRLRIGDYDGAKLLLNRSIQSLSRHKHVEIIQKYGFGEYEFGSIDRARVIFTNLIGSYPSRIDIWNIYIDKEIKLGNVAYARQLFERLISLKTSSRNIKSIFKKYLNFEINHGDLESQENVKRKAIEYVKTQI
jgi:rRNA biogenesis protein RRP5